MIRNITITNLTLHDPTPKQIEQGVGDRLPSLEELLIFKSLPTYEEIVERAEQLAKVAAAKKFKYAMVACPFFLISALERALDNRDITPVYSFSKRMSRETTLKDGSVVTTRIFEHREFVIMPSFKVPLI